MYHKQHLAVITVVAMLVLEYHSVKQSFKL